MARAYDVESIETKWQVRWRDEGTYEVDNDDPRPPFYALCMYPYPSGPAHQGHVRNYTFGDVVVRHQTMLGKAVLSPLGFDSFGLPAENAAIKTGTHPRTFTDERIAELKASIVRLGAVYDWRREVRSHDPRYIRWNQVIFLRLLRAGLAYRATAPVNWCPGCQTVLANEQVLADGTCERSGDLVEIRDLEQWFFKITAYADELLAGLDDLEWPERVKTMQRNWIGRSEGAEIDLEVAGRPGTVLTVFTTRPDTLFGMTYAVMAPEHPLVDALTTDEQRTAVEDLRARVVRGANGERERLAAHLVLPEGGHHDLMLEIGTDLPDEAPEPDPAWSATEAHWSGAVPRYDETLSPREARHTYAVLRGLTGSGGGMVAAATTSLPERAEMGRNYDYRYVWIRDQAFAGQAVAADGPPHLLDDARPRFWGRHYPLTDAPLEPKPVQPHLPLLVGGSGERRTLRIVARWADEWNTWGTPGVLSQKSDVLARHCEAVGRDPSTIARSAQVLVDLDGQAGEWRRSMPTVRGSVAQVQDLLQGYADAGVDEFVLPDWNLGTGSRRRDALDRFLTEVAAPFRTVQEPA